MTKTLKALRIVTMKEGDYIIATGEGSTFRAYGAATGMKAARALRAAIRRDPSGYGITQ